MIRFVECPIKPLLQNNRFDFDNTNTVHILYYPSFLSKNNINTKELYEHLLNLRGWMRPIEKMHGKMIEYPRLCNSMYDGIDVNVKTSNPQKWSEEVHNLKTIVGNFIINDLCQEECGEFRYAQMNYYSDGTQYVGLHRDRETEKDNIICSISVGTTRKLTFEKIKSARRDEKNPKRYTLDLNDGDLCIFSYDLCGPKSEYKHGVLKDKNCDEGRFVITFRDWVY